MTRLKNMN